ncbi:LamG domain-containing protein [Janthinobacterium sp. CG3]|uniref:LamG domain-containing protein n=1 Tax=Janthinobacterium sp. CG3 TaxID=1075768 RepID=UPI000344F4C6|nr:LamG domain-containing protein [Janthinobacterium sp. CG3]
MATPITTRAGKGAPLTNDEIDANFAGLRDRVDSEALPEFTQTIHSGAVVRTLVYDTTRDSDGGAWRKRCAGKSWYNEPAPAGAWLGRFANELAARGGDNLVAAPEELDNAGWTQSVTGSGQVIVITPNAALDPDGFMTADQAVFNIGAGTTSADLCQLQSPGITYPSGMNSGSFYIRTLDGGTSVFSMTLPNGAFSSFTATPEWQRVSLSSVAAVAGANYVRIRLRGNEGTAKVATVAIWGVKFNAGAAPTPYVPSRMFEGGYFQKTTDGKFYAMQSAYGALEVVRGNRRDFPEKVAIVGEAARTVIYDLTRPGSPMWMVASNNFGPTAALDGLLITGLCEMSFVADARIVRRRVVGDPRFGPIPVVERERTGVSATGSVSAAEAIINGTIHAVSMVVLQGAPIAPGIGLPVATVAYATAAGVSICRHDGTVANWLTNAGQIFSISISKFGRMFATGGGGVAHGCWFKNAIPTASPDNTVDYSFNASSIPTRRGTDSATGSIGLHVLMPNSMKALGALTSMYLLRDNPAAPTKGMLAQIGATHPGAWQVGDSRGLWLSDTAAETANASGNLVANGAFDVDTAGWTSGGGATLSVAGWAMRVTATASSPSARTSVTCVIGKIYQVSVQWVTDSLTGNFSVLVGTTLGANDTASLTRTIELGLMLVSFVATQATHYITVSGTSAAISGDYFDVDNVDVRLAEADRSPKNNVMIVRGAITKAAAAPGAQMVAYSGFSAANYLDQSYTPNLDFGAGDVCVMGWLKAGSLHGGAMFDRASAGSTARLLVRTDVSGAIMLYMADATPVSQYVMSGLYQVGVWAFVVGYRKGSQMSIYVNGALVGTTTTAALNITNTSATSRIGAYWNGAAPFNGSLALVRISATAPSDEQIAQIYRDELALFQPGAQCTMVGAPTAMSWDDAAETLHVAVSNVRYAFCGLAQLSSEVTAIGPLAGVSACGGSVLQGGTSCASVTQPSAFLRENAAPALLGAPPAPIWATGDGVATDFPLTMGFQPGAVYKQGVLMRDGSSNDYTTSFDGYQWTVGFTAAPLNNHNICIMGVRNG